MVRFAAVFAQGRAAEFLEHRMSATKTEMKSPCLREVVASSVKQYLDDMGQTPPNDLHDRIIREVERPLVEAVLEHTGGNQSKAADILGVTRSTLRTRIKRYGL